MNGDGGRAVAELVERALAGDGEAALADAHELGRELVRHEVMPADAVADWARALQRSMPGEGSLSAAALQSAAAPLVELMMGYSMAFGEQLAQRRDEEQRHLRAIAEQADDGLLVCDADGRVVWGNAALAALLVPQQLRPPCPLPSGGVLAELAPRLRDTLRHGLAWRGELGRAPGRCWAAGVSAIRDRQQRVAGAALTLRDVSHLRALEHQARERDRLRAVGTLAAGVAHDFNNLVGALLGFAEIGLARADEPEAVRATLEQVRTVGLRARALVAQVTGFASPPPAAAEPVELVATLREALGFFEAYRPATLTLQVALPQAGAPVRAERGGVQQLLLNLLNNACHAIGERPGRIEVTLQRRDDAPGWRLVVADDGCGMPPEVAARVFDPFFTTREPGQGTGLGLSTAFGLVQAWGGAMSLHSVPGSGTRFHIDLDAAAAPDPAASNPP